MDNAMLPDLCDQFGEDSFSITALLCPGAQSKVHHDSTGWVWCGGTHPNPLGWTGMEIVSQFFSSIIMSDFTNTLLDKCTRVQQKHSQKSRSCCGFKRQLHKNITVFRTQRHSTFYMNIYWFSRSFNPKGHTGLAQGGPLVEHNTFRWFCDERSRCMFSEVLVYPMMLGCDGKCLWDEMCWGCVSDGRRAGEIACRRCRLHLL